MISTLVPNIEALIIDFDGVLWRDEQAIGSLPDVFAAIQAYINNKLPGIS